MSGYAQPRVILTEEVWKKILWLCGNWYFKEWSAVIWYKMQEDFLNQNSFDITVEDILLMDLGKVAHTQFNYSDPALGGYIQKNLRLAMYQTGLCHSHQNLAVFFSGEDNTELLDNTVRSNGIGCFLSVIVNNKREVIARICKLEKVVKVMRYSGSFSSWEEEEEYHIVWYKDCAVLAPEVEQGFGEDFYERFRKLSTPDTIKTPSSNFSKGLLPPNNSPWIGKQKSLFQEEAVDATSELAMIISADTTDNLNLALKELLLESESPDFATDFLADIEAVLEEGLEFQIYDIPLIQETRNEMEKFRGSKYDLIASLYMEAVDSFLKSYISQNNKRIF